jgi:hypothetical protein
MATPKIKAGYAVASPVPHPLQIPVYTGSRTNHAGAAASSTAEPIPSGARIIEVRATQPVWLRFGTSSVGAAAADANSMYFAAGVAVFAVPFSSAEIFSTHVRIIRAGGTDAVVQIEELASAGV